MTCQACGAQLSASARFCHKCGAAVATAGATGWRAGLPWGVAGAVLGALIAVVAMRSAGAGSSERGADGAAPPRQIRAPDISQMSPQERANLLFNRIMMAHEAGKNDSVQFFLPMALGAYSQLPTLDPDSRYDIGQLLLLGNEPAAAAAQADTILRAVPTHLFGFMLRADAYHTQGKRALAQRAYADFLRNESAELARNRPEYAERRDLIDSFAERARRESRS